MTGDARTDLEDLVTELEQTAARLRGGDLDREEAAALVERCAELANRVGGQLEREARDAASGEGPSAQEQLL
jgi:hypothetical protein